MKRETPAINSVLLLVIELLSYASIPFMFMYATTSQWIISLILMFLFYNVGIAVTFHRMLTHSAFVVGPITKAVFTLFGTLATNGSSLYWVALHTTHHKYSDTDKDVHSPRHGFWRAWFMPMYPRSKVDSTRTALKLAKEPVQIFLHQYYWFVVASYVGLVFYLDHFAIVYAYLFPVMWTWAMPSIVNTICHKWGYRNFDTKDYSTNNRLFNYVTFGESFHNNHHARPSSPNFASNSTEWDPAFLFIKFLVWLKLAKLNDSE